MCPKNEVSLAVASDSVLAKRDRLAETRFAVFRRRSIPHWPGANIDGHRTKGRKFHLFQICAKLCDFQRIFASMCACELKTRNHREAALAEEESLKSTVREGFEPSVPF